MIRLQPEGFCDVFVAGAGIAGIMAAISAAGQGRRVILASAGAIFSGSSFYPGTWGLGFVTPESAADEADFIQTILQVGDDMADEQLVREFVAGMIPVREYLAASGLALKQAKDNTQKEFIPCFDYKNRNWQGVIAGQAKQLFRKLLEQYQVVCIENCEVVDLVSAGGVVSGAIVSLNGTRLCYLAAGAVVLATGGYGGLYKRRLTTGDVTGMGQYLAMKHGCSLINMEFMQMMPALRDTTAGSGQQKDVTLPVVFHEKTFRYIESEMLTENLRPLLALRSAYGPFTSRLDSRAIDFLIAGQREKGFTFTYAKQMFDQTPEFIATYLQWLESKWQWNRDEPLTIEMAAHAANGGVKINRDGATAATGLFACGEVSGGMHGADRIGGLSTANGFVFGRKAGLAAAAYQAGRQGRMKSETVEFELRECDYASRAAAVMQDQMSRYGMVIRSESGLVTALGNIRNSRAMMVKQPTVNVRRAVFSHRVAGQLELAEGILLAALLRRESRGAHYREDYPDSCSELAKRIAVYLDQGEVKVRFEGPVDRPGRKGSYKSKD